MLDTKLKNRHKLAVVVILLTILLAASVVISQYRGWNNEQQSVMRQEKHNAVTSEEFLSRFAQASYILYNTENGKSSDEIRSEYPGMVNEYEAFYPYLDYVVLDENRETVERSTVSSSQGELSESRLYDEDFAIGMVMIYDENGIPVVGLKQGEYESEQGRVLRQAIQSFQSTMNNEEETENAGMPRNRTYIFAMTEENLNEYLEDWSLGGIHPSDNMSNMILILLWLVAATAWIYPRFRSWETGNEIIFRAPLEVAAIVLMIVAAIVSENMGWLVYRNDGRAAGSDFLIWAAVFALVYWGSACISPVSRMGVKSYLKERCLIGRYWRRLISVIRRGAKFCVEKIRNGYRKAYHSLANIDLREDGTKMILKIVVCNFGILVAVCIMWFFGILALIIYSVILFFILRKYYQDIQKKYGLLLEATGQLAAGNLDVEIREDLGIFNPFKPEIEKIQKGFKRAVDEEVKSQRMKTELITNVSHDLKTPLTAIITYVNLLKEEKDEEKKKEYIDVLERKSLRLKVLIEDLFEISKASSETVILNLVDVDVVSLFKQVKLETEERFRDTDIEFRCSYPEKRLVASLDSQKTYRIFENLLVNISKYALPHTRAYVEITERDGMAVVRMKNVSREELNFNPDEITERFVRGDASRNTEGSGLGLAIAKSFTELQKGKFRIETDADLFKVEIQFLLKKA